MDKQESLDKLIGIVNQFISDSNKGKLKTKEYPERWKWSKMKISFGQGTPSKVPWISFLGPGMKVSKGIYVCYLYYKDHEKLVLSYGLSETNPSAIRWPEEIENEKKKIRDFFEEDNIKYEDSFVEKTYDIKNNKVDVSSNKELYQDLSNILDYYKKVLLEKGV